MTAQTTTTTIEAAEGRSALASFPRLLAMEWTKLRTVRSTWWSIGILAVVSIGFSALISFLVVHSWAQTKPEQQAETRLNPTGPILGGSFSLAELAVCVLGVLVITSEYGTGMIRSSLLAVPTRVPMLAAKGLVFAATMFVVGEILSFAVFFVGAPILNSKVPISISDQGVLGAIIGNGLYLAVLGLFSMAIGALVRHTAGAITGVIAFVLVLAPLTLLIPGSAGRHVHGYMPSEAGALIRQVHQGKNDVLSPWQGFGVFCLWTALLLVVAGYLLERRDA